MVDGVQKNNLSFMGLGIFFVDFICFIAYTLKIYYKSVSYSFKIIQNCSYQLDDETQSFPDKLPFV